MNTSFKAMIVVLGIAAVIFRFAKPIALRFSSEQDFSRRRNVWFAMTVTAFLSPNFWLFALVAIPLLAWAGRRDTNPVALYLLLLQVIPAIPVNVPMVGMSYLISIDNYRLLSFCVLIPTALRLRRSKDPARIHGLQAMDYALLAYGAVQTFLFVPPDLPDHTILHDSVTDFLRRTFLFFVDTYVLYFVVSRSCSNRRAIAEAQAAFCLSCAVMAAVAVFENVRHWLLYTDIAIRWSGYNALAEMSYVMRGDTLRAQASTGHALALGYLLAIAFGFWLYLQRHIPSSRSRIAVVLVLWLGLLAAYSRGPWIGAVAIYFAFAALGPRAIPQLFKAIGVALLIAGAISLSPLGDRIVSVLPFLGGAVDSGNLTYRQRLAERSWELIQEHPVFGDQLAFTKMEDLRQGQGIIDMVNTYAGIALFDGLVGLSLFVAFILMGLIKTFRTARRMTQADPDLALLGVCLGSCILGALLMIENCSFIMGIEKMFYVLAGFAAAYTHLGRSPEGRPPAYARSGNAWGPR
jgi:O-Antigen ligase